VRIKIKGNVVNMYQSQPKTGKPVPHIVVNDGEADLPIRCWKRGLTEGLGVGMQVQVTAVLKGRAWQDKWFLDLEAESVDFVRDTKPPPSESNDADDEPTF